LVKQCILSYKYILRSCPPLDFQRESDTPTFGRKNTISNVIILKENQNIQRLHGIKLGS